MGGDGRESGGGVTRPGISPRMKRIPTCSRCGVPTIEDDTHCDECMVDTMIHVMNPRGEIARTMKDSRLMWPDKHRRLS